MPQPLPETLQEIDAQIDLIQKLKEINELLDAIKQGAKVVKGGVTGDRAADETLGQIKALLDQLSGKLAALTERLGAMEKMVSGLASTIQALSTLAQAVARAKEASGAELVRALGDFIWQWRGAMAFLARSLGSLNPIITAYLIVLTKGAEGIAQALEIAEEAIAENRAKLREAYDAVDEALGPEVHIDPEDPDELERLERELEEQLARLLAERNELLRQADATEWEAARAAARREILAGQDISGWIDGYLEFVRKFLPDATMPDGYNTRHQMSEADYEALKEIQLRLQNLIDEVILNLSDPTQHTNETRAEFWNSKEGEDFRRLLEFWRQGQKKLNEIEAAIQNRAIEILRQHRPQVLERAGLASADEQPAGFIPVAQEVSFFRRTGVWAAGGGLLAALVVMALVFALCLRPETVNRTGPDGTDGAVTIPSEFNNLASILGLAGLGDEQILEFIESLSDDEIGDLLYSISTERPGDPGEDVDIRRSGTGGITMDGSATDLAFNFSTLPCNGAGEVSVACVSQSPIPAGEIVVAVTIVEGEIPQPGAAREYVYGAAFEATGNPADDFTFEPPFDWDFYQNTETWHELVLPAGSNQWQARATRWNGTQQEPRPSAARVAFAGDTIVWFIPAGELVAPEPTARLTAFRHDGSFLPEKSAGDVGGENPTIAPVPVKSTAIEVKGGGKSPSPSPAAQQETVQEFFAKFGEAFRAGDEKFFFDRLAPQVIELYGEGQCRAQTERQQGTGSEFEVRSVQGPQAAEVTLDNQKISVADAYVVELVIRGGTQERTQTSHVIVIDGLVRWFTDCGNPL